jgi:hypothetical protein
MHLLSTQRDCPSYFPCPLCCMLRHHSASLIPPHPQFSDPIPSFVNIKTLQDHKLKPCRADSDDIDVKRKPAEQLDEPAAKKVKA